MDPQISDHLQELDRRIVAVHHQAAAAATTKDAAVSGGLEMRGVASAEDTDFDARVAAMKTWLLEGL